MPDNLCRIELPDLEKRLKELDRLSDAQMEEIGRTGYQELELIMTEAKELTPVDMGALRASGHIQLPKQDASGITVEFGFGGVAGSGNLGETNKEDVGYAVTVHEDLDAYHDDGEAKYLEKPVTAHQGDLDQALVKALDTATQKTITP